MRVAHRPARVTHHACLIVAGVVFLAACDRIRPTHATGDDAAIVAALGARDGYLFVLNPFNCSLREPQIREINKLTHRARRGGRLLMAGTEPIDSIEGARAIRELGILLPASNLSESPFATTALVRSLGWPLAIAVRDGRVIAVLAGGQTNRVGTWIPWLEHSAGIAPTLSPTPGASP